MKKYLIITLLLIFSNEIQSQQTDNISNKTDSELNIKKQKMNSVSVGKIVPNGELYNLDKTKIPIDKFRGKYLIIDFWATWCSPCLKEAPIFKKFEKKYMNSNVEFISISIDQEFDYWKKHIKENNWTGNNYWFGMNESEPFFSLLYSEHKMGDSNVVLIILPKYVIISPNGKILNNSDLRPSKPEFEKELIKYLK